LFSFVQIFAHGIYPLNDLLCYGDYDGLLMYLIAHVQGIGVFEVADEQR